MSDLIHDFRYALRGLARSRGFTLASVAILALGIGANTAVFTIVDPILLRRPNLPSPDELVRIYSTAPDRGVTSNAVGVGEHYDWRSRGIDSLESFSAYYSEQAILSVEGVAERVELAVVGEDFFSTLGVGSAEGRTFAPTENGYGQNAFAVLSHGLWQRRFAGAPDVVGRVIRLDGNPVEVVGVMPAGFSFPTERAVLWTPMAFEEGFHANRDARYLNVIGRLRAGVSRTEAQAEMDRLAAAAAVDHPASNAGIGYRVADLQADRVAPVRRALLFLQIAVGLLLLIACIDVANLLLARARHRVREMSLRFALGASRGRLVRLLLAEAAVLAALGASAALLVAWWLLDLFSGLTTRIAEAGFGTVTIDSRVFLFTLAAALLTVVLFGMAPALVLSRGSLARSMQDGGRGASVGRDVVRIGRGLVFGQVALATLLTIGAVLAGLSLTRLLAIDLGFRTESVTTLGISLPEEAYEEDTRVTSFYDSLLERTSTIPGVAHAGAINWLPVGGSWQCNYEIEGRAPAADARDKRQGLWRVIRPGYLETLDVPLISGRAFDRRDIDGQTPVIVVNETLARAEFPNGALGQRMRLGCEGVDEATGQPPWRTIVGVVGGVRQFDVTAEYMPGYYVPHGQLAWSRMTLVARGGIGPESLAEAVRGLVAEIDPGVAVHDVSSMDARVRSALALPRAQGMMTGCFAVLAVLLGGFGIYGLLSYRVAERRYEFGIRAALGATARSLETMVLGDGMRLVVGGLAAGVVLAIALARLARGLLYGVSVTDPRVYLAAVGILGAIGLFASWLPARRAARLDVADTLRAE